MFLGEGRVERQAQVRARSLQVRRHGEGASNHGRLTEPRWRPREPQPRLEVEAAVVAIVEGAAIAVRATALAREILRAADRPEVRLSVVYFDPRGVGFVAQT